MTAYAAERRNGRSAGDGTQWSRRRTIAASAGSTVALAGLLAAAIPSGLINIDAGWSLIWADQLVHGRLPDYAGGPTPHPLVNALSVPMVLLGDEAQHAVLALSYLTLAALLVVAVRLAHAWFGPAIACVTALLLLSRPSLIAMGIVQYADTLFATLCAVALLSLARDPRATWAPLGALALAGLLRPEAWLFSAALVALRLHRRDHPPLPLLAAAAAAPVLWAACDLAVTGDPLYSFTGTAAGTAEVGHETGLTSVPSVLPERLAETIGKPTMLVGAAGVVLAAARLRRRSTLALVALVVSVGAVVLEGAAGLPILGRYLILPGVLLLIFAGVAVVGWRLLAPRRPLRWMAVGLVSALALATFAPERLISIERLQRTAEVERRGSEDVKLLLRASPPRADCGTIAVTSRRLVPLVAYWLGIDPSHVVTAQLDRPASGTYIVPLDPAVRRVFRIEINSIAPDDPRQRLVDAPPGFAPGPRNRSWQLFERCDRG